jgi:acetoin utilization deacetylase AcuC-like enzyme
MSNRNLGFLYSDTFLEHNTPSGHPERADRLRHLVKHLSASELWGGLRHLQPVAATAKNILAVHSERHIDLVRSVCKAGGGLLDEGDTYASGRSYDVAMLAAGCVLTAIDAVVGGRIDSAFCAVRPPGHHAEQDMPMGFCLFNNVAVGARNAQQRHGVERVAILDWDVHHGNGTQHIFEADPSVLYVSLHQYPFYPGTGARNEQGTGKGRGYTLNVPFPAGTGEAEYLAAFKDEIVPLLKRFDPGLLIVSAGFDAHEDDPLANMKLTEDSFAKMTSMVKGIAPIVSVLEGGYNLDALARSVEKHLSVLAL